jgi:hypothetical protein
MNGKPWTAAQLRLLKAHYPHKPTTEVARLVGRPVASIYAQAGHLGLHKTPEYLASPSACRLRRGDNVGASYRFLKGHVPANKGTRRPGWHAGRMCETQFKKGQFPFNRDPDFYVIGALRVNADGYIDMRVSFKPGAMGWRCLHRILWEDRHGPIPKTHIVTFKNGDPLDCWHDNLELISRADHCRRNSVHNLPAPLKTAIHALGQLKRRINEKRSGRAAGHPVRNHARPA